MKYLVCFLLVVVGSAESLNAQNRKLVLKKDLAPEWLTFDEGKYQLWNGSSVNTIYCRIEPLRYNGDYLSISSYQEFSLFVNGKLLEADRRSGLYSLDSLHKLFPDDLVLLVGIHQDKPIQGVLQTTLVTPHLSAQPGDVGEIRPDSFFRDFVVVALLVLLVLTVVIIQLNPKLASDYFSVSRIFSMREVDDSQVYTRISSSTNILFYLEGSLMIGFCLMVIFEFTLPVRSIGFLFQSRHFWEAILQWTELSAIIMAVFLFKILLVYGTSYLFGLREISGIHFFNWVRILLLSFSFITVIMSFYFISRGQSLGFYNGLVLVITVMLTVVAVVVFMKLKGRMGYSFFHLFSYICATELIPLLITVKLLYQ